MRAVRAILMVLGATFLAAVVAFVWLARSSDHFKTEQEPFAKTFLVDFSKRWDPADVYGRAGPAFIEQTKTLEGQHWLSRVSKLGHLKSIRRSEFGGYVATPNGKSGTFTFRATFENGEATITVTVYNDGQTSKVEGLFVTDGRFNEAQHANFRVGGALLAA
jgi:hypothetical protein